MNGPGKILQQARKKKRYSMEKIHKSTRIKKEFIEGLENDDISVFPAELYYKNFLKTYAQFLALDPNEMINLYEQSKLEQQQDLFKQSNTNIENKFVEFYKKNKKTFIYVFYAICATIVICLIIILIPIKKTSDKTNNLISIKATDSIAVSTSTIDTEPKQVQTEQKLYVKAIADTWIKIVGDDKKLFETILYKGKTFEANAQQDFIVKIGNIDGVEVYFNDKQVDISKGASNSKVNTITLKRD